ncbi:MAG: CxxxxCH/CxxCH domain-containing protein [Candidatus Deferrimicrobiaceae bacterium]
MRTVNYPRVLRPLFYVVCAVLFLGGCSSSSETTSSFIPGPGGGTHPVDFLSTHPGFAVSDVGACTTCHGDDLTGGIADTSCFTAACHHEDPGWASPAAHGATAKRAPGNSGFKSCQICHASDFSGGGSGVSCFLCHAPAPHASQWLPGDTYVHTTTNEGNAPVCALCHYNEPGAGAHTPIPPPVDVNVGCFNNTLCHGAVAAHAVPFLAHTGVTEDTFNDPFPDGCAACHAVTGTSPMTGAPLCTTCHTEGSPLTLLDCTSCHAEPPSGTTYANIEGAHTEHIALNSTGSPVSCDTCHNGLGSGTQSHYDRAKTRQEPASVAFTTTYNAETGAPTFDSALASLSCSNVSCHGGQTTPNWRTEAIDVNTQCTSCHAYGTSQYNSYNSGRHNLHVNEERISCTECHNMELATTGAQNHFAFLGTTQMEGPASDTFQNSTGNVVYNTTANTCTGSCHEGHDNERWFGGD